MPFIIIFNCAMMFTMKAYIYVSQYMKIKSEINRNIFTLFFVQIKKLRQMKKKKEEETFNFKKTIGLSKKLTLGAKKLKKGVTSVGRTVHVEDQLEFDKEVDDALSVDDIEGDLPD